MGIARSRGAGAVLRLDGSGVTVRQYPPVPWSDVRELVIGPLRPAWFLGVKRYPVVAFIPRAGVELPDPPYWGRRRYTFGRRIRARWYGTSLTVLPHAMTASAEQIAAAAERPGGIPTRRIPIRRFTRSFLLAMAVLLLVAFATGWSMARLR